MASRDREGYILIDRNMCDWKWWQKHNTVIVFLWLLMKAQFHDSYFCGVKIERGQVATSIVSIGKYNGLSRQEVRTAISNLKSTNAITTERYSKFIVITIVNYDEYQNLTIKKTKEQHSSNHHVTITQPHTNTYNTDKADKRSKGRSAPESPDGVPECGTDEFRRKSHLLLKPEEGTLDDIPETYRKDYTSFADYWRDRNQ